MLKKVLLSLVFLTSVSCSLVGIQKEETLEYKVLKKDHNIEVREYSPYIVAKVTLELDEDTSTGDAFRILAGYIFGKNEGEKKIAMTSPVEVEQKPAKIAMTSPVEINKNNKTYTMAFSMPSKYTLETLPKPIDTRIQFEKVPSRTVATYKYTWFRTDNRNEKYSKELSKWITKEEKFTHKNQDNLKHTYAGYNPPWTLPFFKRHEVLIEVNKVK